MLRRQPAFPGGIVLPAPGWLGRSRLAGDGAAWQLPFASRLSLPLRQGACTPAAAVVRDGEEVVRGQLLARADGAGSVPLHAPASGMVQAIVEQADLAGGTVPVIQLVPWPGDTQEQVVGTALDPASASPAAVLEAIAATGLVDLGGERRPLHARVGAAAGQGVGWLVLNGIGAEPGVTGARATLRTQAAELMAGLRYLLKASGATRVVLAVEPHDEQAARGFMALAAGTLDLFLRVLPPRYPQGADALLLRALADTPAGGVPASAGPWALCVDVATVAEAGRLLPWGLGMTDQVVTLAGSALREPGQYRVPLGTPLRFALAQAGLDPGVARVLGGGPMRGEALASLDAPITKGANAFIAMSQAEAGEPVPAMPCIRCGECLVACPVQLNPAELGLLARRAEYQVMHEKYHLDHCLECGCCNYVCPSRIPLVEQFRAARMQWRRRQQATVGEDAA